jgi:hypothetical protein
MTAATGIACPACGVTVVHDTTAAEAVQRAALANHAKFCGKATVTRLPVVHAVPATCKVCEDVTDLLEAGETHPETIAQRAGKTTGALHKHLLRCGRKDLIRRIPSLAHTAGKQKRTPKKTARPKAPAEPVPASPAPAAKRPPLADLLGHWDQQVVSAAAACVEANGVLQQRWEQAQARREQELADLLAQRAELEERIAQLEAGQPPAPAPSPQAGPLDESSAAIRAWCRTQGIACNPTGRVPRALLERYREAHA